MELQVLLLGPQTFDLKMYKETSKQVMEQTEHSPQKRWLTVGNTNEQARNQHLDMRI